MHVIANQKISFKLGLRERSGRVQERTFILIKLGLNGHHLLPIIFVSLARLDRNRGRTSATCLSTPRVRWRRPHAIDRWGQYTVKYGQPGTASEAMADVAPPVMLLRNTTSFHVLKLGKSHKSGHSSSVSYRSAFGSPERPFPIPWPQIAQCPNTVWPRRRRRWRLRSWCKEKPKPAQAPGSARRPLGYGARLLFYPSNKAYPQVPKLKPSCNKTSIIYTFFVILPIVISSQRWGFKLMLEDCRVASLDQEVFEALMLVKVLL